MLRVLIQSWAFVGCHSDGHFWPKPTVASVGRSKSCQRMQHLGAWMEHNLNILRSNPLARAKVMLFFGMQRDATTINGWLVHLKDVWTMIEHHKGHDDNLLHVDVIRESVHFIF